MLILQVRNRSLENSSNLAKVRANHGEAQVQTQMTDSLYQTQVTDTLTSVSTFLAAYFHLGVLKAFQIQCVKKYKLSYLPPYTCFSYTSSYSSDKHHPPIQKSPPIPGGILAVPSLTLNLTPLEFTSSTPSLRSIP